MISLLFVTFLFTVTYSADSTVEHVAVIDGKKISKEALDKKVELIKSKYSSMGRPLEGEQLAALRENILNNMIQKDLLYLESRKQGIEVDPAAVKSELDKIRSQFPDPAEFEKKLKEMDYTLPILEEQIKENLAIQKLIDQEIANRVKLSDDEVKSYYEANKAEFSVPEQIRARHILIKVAPEASDAEKAEARKKIVEVQNKLKKGDDFAELAKAHSEGPSNKNGGALGYFSRGQMVETFDNAAFSLETGQVSDIVETRFGYHLIKVEDRKPKGQKTLEEMSAPIREELRRQQVMQKINPYIESLKKKYSVEINLPATKKD